MLNNKRPHNLFKYQIRELAQGRFAFMNFNYTPPPLPQESQAQ